MGKRVPMRHNNTFSISYRNMTMFIHKKPAPEPTTSLYGSNTIPYGSLYEAAFHVVEDCIILLSCELTEL